MAKITIEFDDTQDSSQDISAVVNRHKLLNAVNDLDDLFRQIYNGKIYDPDIEIYLKSDNCKATEEDFKKASETGKLLSGGKYYLDREWVENELNHILENIREFLY
jgi:hypothetical protein